MRYIGVLNDQIDELTGLDQPVTEKTNNDYSTDAQDEEYLEDSDNFISDTSRFNDMYDTGWDSDEYGLEIEDEYMKQSQVYDNREEMVCKKQQASIDSRIKKVMEKVPKEKILKCFE